MIDLIIPVYNNREGLLQTLSSINFDIFEVSVINDGTKDSIDSGYPINSILLEENVGPGTARQLGLEWTSNDYVMFLDAGDIFISKEIQQEIKDTIEKNLDINMFMWSYYYKDTKTTITDNRMHGKVYKRSFIDKYNITFCADGSYFNEDVGFNIACRILLEKKEHQEIYFINKPIIKWIFNSESLSQKDNKVTLYRDQTRALSINSIHAIDICISNDVFPQSEINQIAVALYYWFIRAAAERPEYINEAWKGAKIFYNHFKNHIKPNDLILGNVTIKRCMMYRNKIKFPINILRFCDDIFKNENLPDKYLT